MQAQQLTVASASSPKGAQPQQTQQPTPSLNPVECLTRTCGNKEQAIRALEKTKTCSSDPLRWVNEAALFLAEEADLEAERKALAEAMAVSLSEEEDRKAAKVPLKEWTNDSLLDYFRESIVIEQLPGCASGLDLPCREELIDVLEFERQACKWFPGAGTKAFFKDAVETTLQEATFTPAASLNAPTKRKAGVSSSSKGGRRGTKLKCKQPAELHTRAPVGGVGSGSLVKVVACLFQKVQLAQQEVYRMPAPDNQMPAIFQKFLDPADDDSDVEVLCDVELPAKKQVIHSLA